MKIPIRNVYYLLCYAWRHLAGTDLIETGALDDLEQVQDLLGKVLAEGTFRLVRRGIDRGYREISAEIVGVRGKLEPAAMARTATRARGRTVCTFEEFSPDILHNQILRSTLDVLLRGQTLDQRVRRDVLLAHEKLAGVSIIHVNGQSFRRVQLDSNQRHYRFLLEVCRLVHESLLVEESGEGVAFRDFREDEAVMWRLFEDFCRSFFSAEQKTFAVLPGRRIPWYELTGRTPDDETYMPVMEADILLESEHRRIILDTKFYGKPLSHWYGSEKLHSANLYQVLAYLENRQGKYPEGPRHEGLLLYAAVDRSIRIDVTVCGFRIRARTVDLSRSFHEIRREMLEILDVDSAGCLRRH